MTGVLKYGSTIIDEKTYDHNTAQANMKLTNKITSSLTTPRTITITKGTDSSYQFSIAIDSAGDSTSGSYKFNNGTSYSTGQTLSGTLRGNSINLTFPSKTYYAHVTITNGNSAGNYYVVSSDTLINTTSTGRGSAPTTNNFTMLANAISGIEGNSSSAVNINIKFIKLTWTDVAKGRNSNLTSSSATNITTPLQFAYFVNNNNKTNYTISAMIHLYWQAF